MSALAIRVTDPSGRVRELELRDGAIIGREPACALVLDDGRVSARHARLDRDPRAGFVLVDLGSTNGIRFPDGTLLVPRGSHPLQAGERLHLGETTIEIVGPVPDSSERGTERVGVAPSDGADEPATEALRRPPVAGADADALDDDAATSSRPVVAEPGMAPERVALEADVDLAATLAAGDRPTPQASASAARPGAPEPVPADASVAKTAEELVPAPAPAATPAGDPPSASSPSAAPAAEPSSSPAAAAAAPEPARPADAAATPAPKPRNPTVALSLDSLLGDDEALKVVRPRFVVMQPVPRVLPVTTLELEIGRDPQRESARYALLVDPSVSKRHARIRFMQKRCFIEDCGSRNGTLVEGERLAPMKFKELAPDVCVTFGTIEAVYLAEGDPEGSAPDQPPHEAALEALTRRRVVSRRRRDEVLAAERRGGSPIAEALLLAGDVSARDWCDAVKRGRLQSEVRKAARVRDWRLWLVVLGGLALIGLILWLARR